MDAKENGGIYLKTAFRIHGIDQKAVGKYLGVTQGLISMILDEKVILPLERELAMLTFLGKALQLKIDTEDTIKNGLHNKK